MTDPGVEERLEAELEILAERYARLGRASAGAGGAIGGGLAGMFGGAKGGERGARRAVNRMKNDVCELEVPLTVDAAEALARVEGILAHHGELIEPPYTAPGVPTVAAVFGSGLQNAAVVTVEVLTSDGSSSNVHIRAVAKEPLIKQHSGEKAAKRVKSALTDE